jgi:hypothetical protein
MKKLILIFMLLMCLVNFYAGGTEKKNSKNKNSRNEITLSKTPADLIRFAVENNSDILLAKANYSSACKNLTGTYLSFLPVINPKGGIDYSQKDGFDFKTPEAYFFGIDFMQKIPGVGNLYLNPVVLHEKDAEEYFTFSLDYRFTQSTFPFWYKWMARNPETQIPKLSKNLNELIFFETRFHIIDELLQSFKNYKGIIFALDICSKKLELCKIQAQSYKQIVENQGGSFIDYFEAEKKVTDYEKEKKELENQKVETELYIQSLTGLNCTYEELLAILGECIGVGERICVGECIAMSESIDNNVWVSSFLSDFPEWNYSFINEVKLEKTKVMKEQNQAEYLLQRENLAPVFYVEGNVSYTKQERHRINCTVGFDFSKFLNGEKLSYKTQYKEQKAVYEKQYELEKSQGIFRYNFYLESLQKKEEESALLKNEVEARKRIMDDFHKLYESRQCSRVDYLESEVLYFQALYNFILTEDEIIYYKLLLAKL